MIFEDVNLFIYYFHMPFFFLCSGLMFNVEKEGGFTDFFKKKAKEQNSGYMSQRRQILNRNSNFAVQEAYNTLRYDRLHRWLGTYPHRLSDQSQS